MRSKEDDERIYRWLDEESHDHDAILRRLLHEASTVVPGLSPDPQLTDPLVRLLLSSFAREYVRLYGQLDDVIDVAHQRVVWSLLGFPRAPQPSSCVALIEVNEPDLPIDEDLQVIGRKAMAGGNERNIFFSPQGPETIPGIPQPTLVLERANGACSILSANGANSAAWEIAPMGRVVMHLGIDLPAYDMTKALPIFVQANEEAVGALIWSPWHSPGAEIEDAWVPGSTRRVGAWHGRHDPALFRTRSDIARPFSPWFANFAHIPGELLQAGMGNAPDAIRPAIDAGHLASAPQRCWVSITLPHDTNAAQLATVKMHANCCVLFNLTPEHAKFDLGTQPIQDITLPCNFSEIFRLREVHDMANQQSFLDAEAPDGLSSPHRYHLDVDAKGDAILRISSPKSASKPRKVEIDYLGSFGNEADGLEAGSISILYDPAATPGVKSATNLTPSAGGGAAGEELREGSELRGALATRNRAVTPHDYRELTIAFDTARVREVHIERKVVKVARGVRNAIHVIVDTAPGSFSGEIESKGFRRALLDHLQERSAAGQWVYVTINAGA